MDLTVCLQCLTSVIPKADGTCPACGRHPDQPSQPAPIPAALPPRRGRWRRATGGLDVAIGWLLGASGFLVMALSVPFWFLPGMLGGFMLFISGHRSVVQGRRKRSPDAGSALARDARRPVLYLRSFHSDGRQVTSSWVMPSASETFEERLAGVLGRYGPVIAVGRPRERLPELGAARFYVDDAHWQEQVSDLMTQASAVVFLVGSSSGFFWELETAGRIVEADRILIVLNYPFDLSFVWRESFPNWARGGKGYQRWRESRYRAFRDAANDWLGGRLPESIGSGCILFFERDWTPWLLKPGRINPELYHEFPEGPLRPIVAELCRELGLLRPSQGSTTGILVVMAVIVVALASVVLNGLGWFS
jgi:hypothetical protein